MGNLRQIRLCGLGGQGVILAGSILGQAAVNDGKCVSASNAYGTQARGGYARSEVIISKEPIIYPHIIESDILIALSQRMYEEDILKMKHTGALVIYDELLVKPIKNHSLKQIGIAATDRSISEFNNQQAANIIILGASLIITKVVSKQSLILAVKKNAPHRFQAQNIKALEVGFSLGEGA